MIDNETGALIGGFVLEGGFAKARGFLADLRSHYSGPIHLSRSNHEFRMECAIEQRLPGIAGITVGGKVLNIQNALQLDKYGVTWHDVPYEIAPGWLIMHGDESGMSRTPGATALKLAEQSGMSVVCGHSHRAGLLWSTRGYGASRTVVAGMEVGHLMKIDKADYLGPAKINNWANALGILWIHKEGNKKAEVFPELVPILPSGRLMVAGKVYG